MIVLSTTAATVAETVEQIVSQSRWIDGVEVRVDLLIDEERPRLDELIGTARERLDRDLSFVCTVRRASDGGRWSADDADRCTLLARAVAAGYDFIDLESDLPGDGPWGRVVAAADAAGVAIIRSLHDFAGVPADLAARVRELPRSSREIAKAAVTPRSTGDLVRIVQAARELGDEPRILLGMGEYGFPTRVLPGILGNHLTFSSAPGESAAPGHVSPEELVTRYRLRSQHRRTAVFAVIGNPIAHSKSPDYHNRRFSSDGIDAVYVPFLVDDVGDFFAIADLVPVLGFSVTIPHKTAVLDYLTESGDDVRAAAACNTVVRSRTGWRGVNTDVIGFLAPLDEVLARQSAACRVLVLGAGGAARGVVYALLSRGANVLVWNRTQARAEGLGRDLRRLTGSGVSVVGGDGGPTEAEVGPIDVVVNTTSLGMHGAGDPASWYEFTGREIVYDIVYTPPDTPMVRRAVDAGCRVVTGDRMFAAQAAAQYELYRALATGGGLDA